MPQKRLQMIVSVRFSISHFATNLGGSGRKKSEKSTHRSTHRRFAPLQGLLLANSPDIRKESQRAQCVILFNCERTGTREAACLNHLGRNIPGSLDAPVWFDSSRGQPSTSTDLGVAEYGGRRGRALVDCAWCQNDSVRVGAKGGDGGSCHHDRTLLHDPVV